MRYLYPLNQIPNFFIWWYGVRGRLFLDTGIAIMLKTLGYLNLIPMVMNLHRSFFADRTISGYLFSVFLRIIWIFFGLVLFVPVFLAVGMFVVAWFVFPVYVILAIISPAVVK